MVDILFQPESLEETLKLLRKHGPRAKVLAGGTDLVHLLKIKKVEPQYLISINNVPELAGLEFRENGGLRIGAAVTQADLIANPAVRGKYPVLVETIMVMGGAQVRNVATVCGNLCHASPSADLAPPLVALGATVELASSKGRRTMPLEEFFRAPNRTRLKANELLSAVEVPVPRPHSGTCYFKHAIRGAMEIAFVGVAATIGLRDGLCDDVRIVLGAVAPTPIRARKAEAILQGQAISDALVEQAARRAARESKPISDVRCSADYRREMVRVFTMRALKRAHELALRA